MFQPDFSEDFWNMWRMGLNGNRKKRPKIVFFLTTIYSPGSLMPGGGTAILPAGDDGSLRMIETIRSWGCSSTNR